MTYACTSRRCRGEHCTRHALRERQRRLRPLMLDAYPMPWGVVVLPYSAAVRQRVADVALFKASRRAAVALVEETILRLHGLGRGWRLGVVSVDHPEGEPGAIGTEQPEGLCDPSWHPHHNFLFPAVAIKQDQRVSLTFTKNEILTLEARHVETIRQPRRKAKALARLEKLRARLAKVSDGAKLAMLPPFALDALRQGWKDLQNLIQPGSVTGKASLWFGFRRQKSRTPHATKLHALKYFPRTFARWPAKAQRLVYFGAFGAAVLNDLREVKALEKPEAQPPCCKTCKQPFVRFEFSQPVPSFWRTVSGGPSP